MIEIDSALNIAVGLEYLTREQLDKLGEAIVRTFKLLTGMIAK